MRRTGPPGRDRSDGEGPAARLRENVTGITVFLVTGLLLAAVFAEQLWLLPLAIVGYAVVVPLVALLFGSDEEYRALVGRAETSASGDASASADRESTWTEPQSGGTHRPSDDEPARRDALETLRERYAAGELTDDQFERKLERLLNTETLEDAKNWTRDRSRSGDAQATRGGARDEPTGDGTGDGDGRSGRDYEYNV